MCFDVLLVAGYGFILCAGLLVLYVSPVTIATPLGLLACWYAWIKLVEWLGREVALSWVFFVSWSIVFTMTVFGLAFLFLAMDQRPGKYTECFVMCIASTSVVCVGAVFWRWSTPVASMYFRVLSSFGMRIIQT